MSERERNSLETLEELSDDSSSDEGSSCEMHESAFLNSDEEVEEVSPHETVIEEMEQNFMSDEWEWNKWDEI